jgi:predicted solute-binding protein
MQFKKLASPSSKVFDFTRLGSEWFFKVGVPHQFSVTMDRNAAGIPQRFIREERCAQAPRSRNPAVPASSVHILTIRVDPL